MTVNKVKENSIRVKHGRINYKVIIGKELISRIGSIYKSDSKRGILISDRRLKDSRKMALKGLRSSGWFVQELALEAGENIKSFDKIEVVLTAMLKAKLDRDSTVFALGGGSIGDMAGFVASVYMRGIKWVGLPSSLLAQVDSCLGGKTAINHPLSKNLIGSFHQPSLVLCDTELLRSLSVRELISGFGEIVKYALICDPKFYKILEKKSIADLGVDQELMVYLIKHSLSLKANIVVSDEFDRKGLREILNFGHSFGHALESTTGFQKFQHGEAIIWGMRFALAMSVVKELISSEKWKQIDAFLKQIPVPSLPKIKPSTFFRAMQTDKKSSRGRIRMVLLKGVGKTTLAREISEFELNSAFQLMLENNDV